MAIGAISSGPNNRQQRAEERIVCYDLRVQGHSFQNIAVIATAHFGYPISKTKVYELVTEETEDRVRPHREAFIEWELDRLDRMLVALDPKIMAGDPVGITAALRVAERRAKLLGLDAPTRVEAQVQETTQQDIELQELIAEAKARSAAAEADIKRSEAT